MKHSASSMPKIMAPLITVRMITIQKDASRRGMRCDSAMVQETATTSINASSTTSRMVRSQTKCARHTQRAFVPTFRCCRLSFEMAGKGLDPTRTVSNDQKAAVTGPRPQACRSPVQSPLLYAISMERVALVGSPQIVLPELWMDTRRM